MGDLVLQGELDDGNGFFIERHIGPNSDEHARMLATVGRRSVDELLQQVLSPSIVDSTHLTMIPADSERALEAELRELASKNTVLTSMIGLGYYDTILPAVIRRSILENPAWYSAYTPYQAEIAQGRLEALLTFQTMVSDLCALPVANASLLDEPTAVVEGMLMCARASKVATRFVVDADCLPQTIAVLQTRSKPLGIELVIDDLERGLPGGAAFGIVI